MKAVKDGWKTNGVKGKVRMEMKVHPENERGHDDILQVLHAPKTSSMRAHEFGEEFGHAATDLWTLDIDTTRLATSATIAATAFVTSTTASGACIFVC